MIRVQREDFDTGAELALLNADNHAVGGVAAFVGLVREMAGGEALTAMTLEHYPAMTEKALADIEAEAKRRWPLEASLIIHRHGTLEIGERIVLVATAAAHRRAAFEACQFLVDWLKTKAPFWKREETRDGHHWVDAHSADDAQAARWEGGKAGRRPTEFPRGYSKP